MEASTNSSNFLQLFVKLLDGKSLTLRFTEPKTSCHVIKQRIFEITKIPIHSQRLLSSGYQIDDNSVISDPDSTLHLLLRLRGGKGGFGSLLRGAATKAGQKKTSNFDACRDMSGRRLRHVNAEKKLEEWKAEEEERKLEKIAEDFIKKAAKNGKKGVGDGAAEKYVEKYREVSAKCVAAVEEAIREGFGGGNGKGKRKEKVDMEGVDPKRLRIWMGKRKLGKIDKGSMDEDSSDDEEEKSEKSIILNNGDHSDLSTEAQESLDSVPCCEKDGGCSAGASCESGSENEKESAVKQSVKSVQNGEIFLDEGAGVSEAKAHYQMVPQNACVVSLNSEETSASVVVDAERKDNAECLQIFNSACQDIIECRTAVAEANTSASKSELKEETVASQLETPLSLYDYNSAAELEVLGLGRLKTELQAHGLKCGGTLQERAARLFLLKSTPLEKLPKKLFAKK